MKLILLGAPGAGKGTQAELIAAKLNIPTISTGNILREAIKNGTEIGKLAKELIDNGKFVPDDVILGIVEERLSRPDCANGYILDGMPRTIPQAEALEKRGVRFDYVVSIEVKDADIEARMSGRRVCSGCGASYHIVANPSRIADVCDHCGSPLVIRPDDAPETVRNRLEIYHQETEPIREFYSRRGILRTVCGTGTIEKIHADILMVIGNHV